MHDELHDICPKFDDDENMYLTLEEDEKFDFSSYLRPRFDDNDEMFFEDEEVYVEGREIV